MRQEIAKQTQSQVSIFSVNNFETSMKMAETLATSDLVPPSYKNKPANILVAMQMGYEVGLQPMQSLQNIAVINGRPCVWGDAMLAIAQSHPSFEWIEENPIVKDGSVIGYSCKVKRLNCPVHEAVFTIDDAKKAGLWGKQGPWTQYPNRMLQLRARSFALRDTFADALRGIIMAEEARDYPKSVKNITPVNAEYNSVEQQEETVLATHEQVDEFEKLMTIVELEQDILDMWLNNDGVKSISEMKFENIEKRIQFMRKKQEKILSNDLS